MQWLQNGGKCGVCGDAYHMKPPRPHEAGGEYGRGIISRHYFSGQVKFELKYFNISLKAVLNLCSWK